MLDLGTDRGHIAYMSGTISSPCHTSDPRHPPSISHNSNSATTFPLHLHASDLSACSASVTLSEKSPLSHGLLALPDTSDTPAILPF